MRIEFTSTPSSEDIDFLTQKINEENPECGEAYAFAFFIRDEHNHIIAGSNGSVICGSIYTDQLWVHPAHRKNGLGHKLMEAVHDYGRKSGCTFASVTTMSFQDAETFYKKLGYVNDFERPGCRHGSSCLFMKKRHWALLNHKKSLCNRLHEPLNALHTPSGMLHPTKLRR